jgi:hypothetical protein
MAELNGAAHWLQRYAPDVAATVRRFPLATLLAAAATAVVLVAINARGVMPDDPLSRLFFGLAIGAVLAVAGVLFRESRPAARAAGLPVGYGLPLGGAALCQIPSDEVVAEPLPLLVAATLWLSVSAFTRVGRGEVREAQQDRFWWLNHRAIATAGLAAIGFAVIFVGILAIERSLSYLFGLDTGDVFYRWVLPVVGLFLCPVYWLSTLPRLDEYDQRQLEQPDFSAGAVGFLGQFVLAPFLGIYALILFAYAGQIVVTQRLPQGTIGWMVLGFVVAGAGTWLLLHPPFMRQKPLVRLFRRAWWWLTLVPLLLFFVAVWVRVDAYGLTAERLVLVAGGVWAAALAAAFLAGRGDIRLIPGLAGLIFLVLSVGPWSFVSGPDHEQAWRLERLLAQAPDGAAAPEWSPEQAAAARSAMYYLDAREHGQQLLARVLEAHGRSYRIGAVSVEQVMTELGHPQREDASDVVSYAPRVQGVTVDVSATPFYIGHVDAWEVSSEPRFEGFYLLLREGVLEVYREGRVASVDLGAWAAAQQPDRLVEPWVDFAIEGVAYRIVLTSASWRRDPDDPEGRRVTALSGQLFTADRASTIARP